MLRQLDLRHYLGIQLFALMKKMNDIKNILERSEKVTQAGDNPFDKDRKSLVLKPAKEGQNGKNDQGGCC